MTEDSVNLFWTYHQVDGNLFSKNGKQVTGHIANGRS